MCNSMRMSVTVSSHKVPLKSSWHIAAIKTSRICWSIRNSIKPYEQPWTPTSLTLNTCQTAELAPPSGRPSHCSPAMSYMPSNVNIVKPSMWVKQGPLLNRLYQIYHIQKAIISKLLYLHFAQHHISSFSLSGLETNAGPEKSS